MILPWALFGMAGALLAVLLIKIWLLHKSMEEMEEEMEECLSGETNRLISLSTRDRYARHLAAGLNRQIGMLREQRWKYHSKDMELKEAVTNISHDLRTPLTAICGYLELLEKEEKSQVAARYLTLIGERTRAMKHLTEELFSYSIAISTAEDRELQEVEVNGALEESIAAFYPVLTGRGIVPEIRICEKRVLCLLNRGALSRVFENVLHNALKYSAGDLEITLEENGEISFANTAPDLDGIQVGKLFHRYFSVETASNATGLGLTISRNLVEQMKGRMTAEYENQKLKIHIWFPPFHKENAD